MENITNLKELAKAKHLREHVNKTINEITQSQYEEIEQLRKKISENIRNWNIPNKAN